MKSILVGLVISMSFSSAFAAKPTDGLPASVLKLHEAIASQDCEADLDQASESYDVGDYKLYIVPCGMGAYQGFSKVYLAKGDFAMQVIVLAKQGKSLIGTTDLTSASFEPKTGILSSFAKGRGIGDCGQSSETIVKPGQYGAVDIKTIQIADKSKCDGKYDKAWPVVFRQK